MPVAVLLGPEGQSLLGTLGVGSLQPPLAHPNVPHLVAGYESGDGLTV